jgi:Domain of unknown function (DUF4922)
MEAVQTILVDASSPSLRECVVVRPLSDGIRALHAADADSGFVKDDLRDLDYYQIPSGDERPPFFLQFNPRRAGRLRGNNPSSACPLCLSSVHDRHQEFVMFHVSGRPMIALSNPWPFMPTHVTLARLDHQPQAWAGPDSAERSAGLATLVADVVSLARALPEFVVIYNGDDAGASIPHHRHYQAFRLPTGHGPLPVETAAAGGLSAPYAGLEVISTASRFPLHVFTGTDTASDGIQALVTLLVQWSEIADSAASANVIARSNATGVVSVYIVPRHRLFRRAVGFAGVLGSLEVAGIFVVSSDAERQAITEGQITHQRLWLALEALSPPQVHSLLSS